MRAVIFDFYFTLAEPQLTNFAELAESLGCAADAVAEQRRVLLAERRPLAPVFDGEHPSFRSFHDYWVEFGDDLFARLGVEGGGKAYASNRRAAHEAAVVYPEVPDALETLRNSGLRLGILSDADSDQLRACLASSNLRFDTVICSEDLRCYKPHRSVFNAACEALGAHPAEAAYVGDTPVNDVEGSRRAGLRAVWLNRRGLTWPEDLDPPDLVAKSLDNVRSCCCSSRHDYQRCPCARTFDGNRARRPTRRNSFGVVEPASFRNVRWRALAATRGLASRHGRR